MEDGVTPEVLQAQSAMHRAEEEVFDCWEELTQAVGLQMEGRGNLDIDRLKAQLRDAEAKAWDCVSAACALVPTRTP